MQFISKTYAKLHNTKQKLLPKQATRPSRFLAWALTVAMLLGMMPFVMAVDDGMSVTFVNGEVDCNYVHACDTYCGYIEAVQCDMDCEDGHDFSCAFIEGVSCTYVHVHDEHCGFVEAASCTGVCGADCASPASMIVPFASGDPCTCDCTADPGDCFGCDLNSCNDCNFGCSCNCFNDSGNGIKDCNNCGTTNDVCDCGYCLDCNISDGVYCSDSIGVPFAAVVAAVVTQISVTTAMGECVGVAEIVRLVMMQTYAIADSAWIVISRAVFTALPAIGVPIAAVVLTTNAIVRMVVIVTLVFTMTTVTIAGLTVVIAAVAMTAQWELI